MVASASPTCASEVMRRTGLEGDIHHDRGQRRLDRRRGIAAGEKRGDHAAHQHERKQADGIGGKRLPGGSGVGRREGAAHEQRPHDEVGNEKKGDDARDREQQRELDGAVLGVPRARLVADRDAARHFRQHHGAGRDADDPDRQLVEPVRIVERRQGAGGKKARDDGVGEERDLQAGRADGRRSERLEEAPDVLVPSRTAEHRQTPCARRRRRPARPRGCRRRARPRPPHVRRW